jgi:nitroimidazol reductase NimA-like FMN-containing flavoprotein (pyridoxamine 5'-phosphate oxidase superfamily)
MRLKEREIKDRQEMEGIIQRAQVCRVGFSEKDIPYIVPMDFGYKDNQLFFHCATKGKKLDMIRQNNNVCFEMDIDHQIFKPPGRPCGWNAKYYCVIGFGKALVIEDFPEKSTALNIITQHYGGDWYEFSEKELEGVGIIMIEISSMTGKKAGY